LSFFPKQVRGTLIALLDTFWGPTFTRPNINSGNTETFDFGPEAALSGTLNFTKGFTTVKGVGTLFTSEVAAGDFIKPSGSSGIEYAKVSSIESNTILTLSVKWASTTSITTSAQIGPVKTLKYIVDKITTKTLRLLPNGFADLTAVTIAELITFINTNVEHNKFITASEFIDPVAGNKLNLRTTTPGLQGSIQILGGTANSPTIFNFSLVEQNLIRANVFEVNPNEIVITIPSSVPVLRRSLRGSSHPRETKVRLFSTSKEIFDFSGLGASSTLTIEVDGSPTTVTFTHGTDFNDSSKVTSREVAQVINAQVTGINALHRNFEDYKAVGLETTNGETNYQVTGGTANAVLSFATTLQTNPEFIDPLKVRLGSFIFDPEGQLFTVAETQTTLATTIANGSINTTIALADASSFPNQPGKFILNFGKANQEGPIDYNSRPNNSTLLIDASHIFENEHLSGSTVNFVANQATVPRVTGEDYPVYITGTEQARLAAQDLIQKLIAAGVVIRFIISFPEFLFECVCRDCGPPESADYRGSLTGQGPLSF